MPVDEDMTASLAYRKNEAAILKGDVPEKYLRLLPHIPGERILEIGSAEGVLALLLARADFGNKRSVIALERQESRHEAALELRDAWFGRFRFDRNVDLRHYKADIRDSFHLLSDIDTLLAIRMVYYLGGDLDAVFAEVAKNKVPNVVLCGNKNRNDKADNYYASHEGMTDLLLRHGYRIKTVIEEGDPIVVGSKGV
jgi:predicted O-methyltransferase YrrM